MHQYPTHEVTGATDQENDIVAGRDITNGLVLVEDPADEQWE